MAAFSKIPVAGRVEAGRRFVADLLGKAGFGAVLVQKTAADGRGAPPALISSAERLEGVNPFAGVMPVNAGSVVAKTTKVEAFPSKTAVILRPCEARALVELVKLRQARRDNLLIVGTDCPGTYPHKDFAERAGGDAEQDLARRLEGTAEGLRDPCRFCVTPSTPWADLRLCLYGTPDGALLEPVTPHGEETAAALGYETTDATGREEALKRARAARETARDAAQAAFLPAVEGHEKVLAFLSTCLRCQNCRAVCPVCYCRECFFDSPTFDLEGGKYLGWAAARGALRMPADTLLFHLTRLNHMVHSCVACGMCTQGCPAGIEVGLLFSSVGRRVQKVFDYDPGRSPDDEIPLSTFREDELEVFGGK